MDGLKGSGQMDTARKNIFISLDLEPSPICRGSSGISSLSSVTGVRFLTSYPSFGNFFSSFGPIIIFGVTLKFPGDRESSIKHRKCIPKFWRPFPWIQIYQLVSIKTPFRANVKRYTITLARKWIFDRHQLYFWCFETVQFLDQMRTSNTATRDTILKLMSVQHFDYHYI